MELLAKTCKSERMNIERLFARALVVAGGLFWAIAAFGAADRYGAEDVMSHAYILLGITVVVLVIGWMYENLAAMVLLALTLGFIIYGLVTPTFQGETGVWAIWMLFTAAPTFASALLFLLAARMQKICELDPGTVK